MGLRIASGSPALADALWSGMLGGGTTWKISYVLSCPNLKKPTSTPYV